MSEYATTKGQRKKYTRLYKRYKSDSPEEATRRARRLISQFVKEVPPNGVYLGISAGRGTTEAGIHNSLRHLRVVLVDVAKRKPVYSTRRNPNVLNLEADAHALPLRDESVDVASCLMSQDFYQDRSKATREAYRVLKPGAPLVLFLHHPKMFEDELTRYNKYYTTKGQDVKEFWEHLIREKRVFSTAGEIRDFYSRHGFQIESVVEHKPSLIQVNPFLVAQGVPVEPPGNYWWEVILKKPQ